MKTYKDPRHLNRIQVMKDLFSWDFSKENLLLNERAKLVVENLEQIDKLIKTAAPTWPVDKINKIDLAILRLATFELIIEKEVPEKVVIDEAIELAKEYGSESSSSFVNGVLGKVVTERK